MKRLFYIAFLPLFFYACTVIQYDVREERREEGEVEIENFDITVTKMRKTELNGKIGTGKGTIVLETSNSDILIR